MRKINVVIFLLIGLSMFASPIIYSDLKISNYDFSSDKDSQLGKSDQSGLQTNLTMQLNYEIKKNLLLEGYTDLIISEIHPKFVNFPTVNKFRLAVQYKNDSFFSKVKLYSRGYDTKENKFTTLLGFQNAINQKRINYIDYQLNFSSDKISTFTYLKARQLTFEANDDDEFDNDVHLKTKIQYELKNDLKMFVGFYHKNDLNDKKDFNYSEISVGLKLDRKIGNMFVDAETSYSNNPNSNYNLSYKEHYFYTKCRVNKPLTRNLSGFVTYINRSFFDTEDTKLYRLANMVKIAGKYSWNKHLISPCYLVSGIKVTPEKEETTLYLNLNQKIFNRLYSINGMDYSVDKFSNYSTGLEYYVDSIKKVWLKAEISEIEDSINQTVLTFGTTIIF